MDTPKPKPVYQYIVDAEQVFNGHRFAYLETLACGHTGKSRADRSVIEQAIGEGRKRQCFRCTHQR